MKEALMILLSIFIIACSTKKESAKDSCNCDLIIQRDTIKNVFWAYKTDDSQMTKAELEFTESVIEYVYEHDLKLLIMIVPCEGDSIIMPTSINGIKLK